MLQQFNGRQYLEGQREKGENFITDYSKSTRLNSEYYQVFNVFDMLQTNRSKYTGLYLIGNIAFFQQNWRG